MGEALQQPLDFQGPLSHAEKVAARAQQLRWYDVRMHAFGHAFAKLPEADRELLWSLRCGRRSWRLDLPDWAKLARALKPPAQAKASAPARAVTTSSEGVLLMHACCFPAAPPPMLSNAVSLSTTCCMSPAVHRTAHQVHPKVLQLKSFLVWYCIVCQ